jgi:co-chaperonin GroES (HSP10)
MYLENESLSPETLARLPKPVGYRMLIALPKVEEKTKGGIIMPGDLVKKEETASIVGRVLAMGADCYLDAARFPNGAYCGEGDWVMFRAYSGTRFTVDKQEYRLINDDIVEGVVAGPEGYARA